MKRALKGSIHRNSFQIDINLQNLDFVDEEKLRSYSEEISGAIRNYLLFQRFPRFRYPLWLCQSLDRSNPRGAPVSPVLLSNRGNRSSIHVSNLLSDRLLGVDPAGMISPSGASWSVEFWIFSNGLLHRPQDAISGVTQKRDASSSIVRTVWKEADFRLSEEVYGAMTDIDEAIVQVSCSLNRRKGFSALLILFRPYNLMTIGGIESIEYKQDSGIVRVNGADCAVAGAAPDFVIAGNGERGDIDVPLPDGDQMKSQCRYAMATLALGYRLAAGDSSHALRLALSGRKGIRQHKLNFRELKKDFVDFADIRGKNGFNLTIPDRDYRNWFYAAKISVLHYSNPDIYSGALKSDGPAALRNAYYMTLAYNRMGYLVESMKIIDALLSEHRADRSLSFGGMIANCYLMGASADFFMNTRDLGFVQKRYGQLKGIAEEIFRWSSKFGKRKSLLREKGAHNSLIDYFATSMHLHDAILLSFVLERFSYLSRCLGLFGDELRFGKESKRVESLVLFALAEKSERSRSRIQATGDEDAGEEGEEEEGLRRPFFIAEDDFFIYNLFCRFPFRLGGVDDDLVRALCDAVIDYSKGLPFAMRSLGGWSSFLSLICAINLVSIGDSRAYDVLQAMMRAGGERYAIPEIISPASGAGIFGRGDAGAALCLVFILLRDMLFVDHETRLELFPIPKQEWFMEGGGITVRDAPSRFGNINFRLVNTPNEVQIFFDELPSFVPQEILINVPFRTRLEKEDDFLVKKEIRNSFLISGWPSVVRLKRLGKPPVGVTAAR